MYSKKAARILIVDDEAPIREVLSASLRDEGYTVETAQSGEEGLSKMRSFTPQIVFLDIWMPGTLDGVEVLTQAKKQFQDTEFIMISGHGTIETAVKATRLGAWDFIEKPLSMDRILINVSNILHFQNERSQKQGLLAQFKKNVALIGESAPMVALKGWITKVSSNQSALLILGERGAGRRLVAQNIHFASPRAGLNFIEVNCANIPLDLFDYEIFGWANGVLPGQLPEQKGKLELAEGGTLYLSEADLIPEASQYKLAKLIKTQSFQRVGSKEATQTSTRLMLSTSKSKEVLNADLASALTESYSMPSLKERPEDILALFWHFSDSILREEGVLRKSLSPAAADTLKKYNWPGNLREFRNFVERLYLLTPTETIEVHDLYFAGLPSEGGSPFYQLNFRQARSQFEKQFLIEKLKEFDGNISKTAEAIGLERSYLHRKLKAYGIEAN